MEVPASPLWPTNLGQWLGAEIVHTDDFASWDNPKDWWPLLIERVFEPLTSGQRTLSYPRSQWWPGHEPEPVVDQPVTAALILEGVGSLRREFRQFLSVAIFIDAPKEICIQRGITRDAAMGTRGGSLGAVEQLLRRRDAVHGTP